MNAILQQFFQRKASPLIQFIKYALSGCVAVLVNMIVFYLLAWLVLPALGPEDPVVKITGLAVLPLDDAMRAQRAVIDNCIAFIFANLVAYLLNIYWVFEPGRHHKVIEISLFYAVSGMSFAIGTALMWMLIHYLSFTTTIAFGAELVSAALINFAMRKFVIFKG
ncbi:MAG: GtrA family protein [Verrucomicrobia bacterium]|nr:GtrA family protein [Verrucomicrobiota bacterium]MBU4292014.1 GtrA family protein [Verrucomicrobiota bacterium]MBU4427902.1 GtrA family protein [Verrucomicrobiota bacterium]MCG2678848.1 GtrA family protein [Kiritimatiellia bacterium]